MEKWIPRKATIDQGSSQFNEGASRQVDKSTEEKDMLDKPLPKGSMLGGTAQPIYKGTHAKHYNTDAGAVPNIPASSELGSNR